MILVHVGVAGYVFGGVVGVAAFLLGFYQRQLLKRAQVDASALRAAAEAEAAKVEGAVTTDFKEVKQEVESKL